MIAAWMAYVFLVGIFSAGAAWILEELLRNHRRPARWVWLAGMALAAVWPVWTALRPEGVPMPRGAPPGSAFLALEPLTLEVGRTSVWAALNGPLVFLWISSSLLLVVVGIALVLRTRRVRKDWKDGETAGRCVLISEDWGPAVVGLVRPQIVLPGWCYRMENEALGLILDHEAEHLKAGDLRLLAFASVFPVVFPWSLPTWWMWHRLRLAAEGDCDLRVLKRNPRATRAYLELLLYVGRRFPRGRVAAAMLSEPERTLARRIRTMTAPIPKRPLLRGALLVAAGALLIGVACAVPGPLALEEEAVLPAVEAAVERSGPPTSDPAGQLMDEPRFTPYTVSPAITNSEDLAAALETQFPPLLKDAGIGGTVGVWCFLDEAGEVRRTLVKESSGHAALDEAALRVAAMARFTAARNGGRPVPVWIALPVTFSVAEERSREALPPPTTPLRGDAAEAPTFTPFTVRPDITNRATIARAMETEYPPLLRDAGVGGTVTVWFFIDETGSVRTVLLKESSGLEALDEAALRVAGQIEFTPALNRDKRVSVWIALPITFSTR